MNTRILLPLLAAWSLAACRQCEPSGPVAADAGAGRVAPAPPPAAADCAALKTLRPGTLPSWAHKDPERYWALFEACMLSQGTACERAWASASKVPERQAKPAAEQEQERTNFMRVCETLAPEVQRCMTAYAFAHQAECPQQKIHEQFNQAAAKLGITPPAPTPAPAP